jgi:hypothetical protein
MTFPELDKKMDKVISDATTHYHGDLMANVGAHARKLIFERVTKTGIDAKGSKFRPYSTKPMLVGCKSMNASVCKSFFGKERNKELRWVTIDQKRLAILEGGYKRFRELHGRQTAFVDFTFGGNMWGDINLISSSADHQRGIAIVGARNPEEKKKLAGNTKRRGDILDLRSSEIDILMKTYSLDFLQVIRNDGL